jgi:hypothetical protein
MSLGPLVREVVGSAVSSIFDPAPLAFRPCDEVGVAPVRRVCRMQVEGVQNLRTRLNRNAFLCDCLDFTEHEEFEHLIVGYGLKHARTTKISAIAHVSGTRDSVHIPIWIGDAINSHIADSYGAEVLIFHNHPTNLLNTLFDNTPLPSGADRQVLVAHLLEPLIAIKAFVGGGRFRSYLGENGFVREFRTPELLSLLENLDRSVRARNA